MGSQIEYVNPFELIVKAIERAKTTPPSREFVEKQISAIYSGNTLHIERLAMALQGLLELIEANKADGKEEK